MALLIRNERDIVELNIRFHASKGVEAFIVIDNGSVDGTYEIVNRLAHEFAMKVLQYNDDSFQQSRWMTHAAMLAWDAFDADLVIPNDADEFWMPNGGGSLPDILSRGDVCVSCDRYNMIPGPNESFRDSEHCVVNPIPYSQATQLSSQAISLLLLKLRPKVLVNPRGLVKIGQGNHRAIHLYRPLFSRNADDISIYHYPVRSFEQFHTNVQVYRDIIARYPAARVGSQWRRWAAIETDDKLEQEFGMMMFSAEELHMLYKIGIIEARALPAVELSAIETVTA